MTWKSLWLTLPAVEIAVNLGEGVVSFELDEDFYPKDAIYGAAYVFIDRCYLHLDRAEAKGAAPRVRVTMRPKKQDVDINAIAGEFQNEALGQAWRLRLATENRAFIESIVTRALGGAAGPPGLEDLLSTDIGEASAFEDPLGIAMSWEEKYGKQKGERASTSTEGAAASVTEEASSEPSKKDDAT